MNTALEIPDPLFRAAVAAIDAGDIEALKALVCDHAQLLSQRAEIGEGYFRHPYLLWFIAENPVRNGRLPANIVDVVDVLLIALQRYRVESASEQVDAALGLVVSGRVARECGVQLALIDRLAEAGADFDAALLPALAHRETAAVERLLARGAAPTLASDAAIGTLAALELRLPSSSAADRHLALMAAAVFGRADAVARLAASGIDLDAYAPAGFHAHSTALHQAVAANSPAAVDALLAAGASREVRDRMYDGTALDWARYLGVDSVVRRLEQV